MKYKVTWISLILCFFLKAGVLAQNTNIIPRPQHVEWGDDIFTLDSVTKIVHFASYPEIAAILQARIIQEKGPALDITESRSTEGPIIEFKHHNDLKSEAYILSINSTGIQIIASDKAGWFYGVQSLGQLIFAQAEQSDQSSSLVLPGVMIKDSPRFAWRALMLDEGRYFKGMDQVKMLLDEMALIKMNVFHWHLVDDQGWRIEIKKYPLLTEIGSKRLSTQVGPLKWDSPIQSAEVHEGYYTQEEIREIVEYAEDRHITIVPEIEMPGHSSAAIAAYSWLGTAKKEIEVPIRFGVGKDVYDVSDPKVNQFLRDVLDEVMELFPSQVIHIGGDEVKYDHWKSSKSVQAYMKENGLKSPAELQVYFTNGISQYLQSKGRRMMGWNEIMGHNLHEYQDKEDTQSDQELAKETVVHFWKGDLALASLAASKGYDIVNSLHSETYLDYSYTSIPLARAYAFDPVPKGLDPKFHEKVIGTGCQMWGEWIPTNGHMHFQTFPRIAAYAEGAWTQLDNKDFEDFQAALKHLKMHWKQAGIYYAPDEVSKGKAE